MLFLHLLHPAKSYLIFETQIKTHLLCEAFPVAPSSGILSILPPPPQFSYGICIHISLLVLSVMCLCAWGKDPSLIFSLLFFKIEVQEMFQ